MKVEVAALGSPSLIVRRVTVDVKQRANERMSFSSELRNCAKVEAAVLGSPSPIIRTVWLLRQSSGAV